MLEKRKLHRDRRLQFGRAKAARQTADVRHFNISSEKFHYNPFMQTLDTINQTLNGNDAVMLYFSAPGCNVCHALKPKLTEAVMNEFPTFVIIGIDISETPEIASHFSVFTIPTVLVFFQGREFLRKSRHMSVGEVITAIERPYNLMAGN